MAANSRNFFFHMISTDILLELTGFNALSGLTKVNDTIFLIADNQKALVKLDVTSLSKNSQLHVPLIADTKSKKADLESIFFDKNQRALYVVPSGSSDKRETGLKLDQFGNQIEVVKFKKLFDSLRAVAKMKFEDFNIEGSEFVTVGCYLVMNRGNGPNNKNGYWLIETDNFPEAIVNIRWCPIELPIVKKLPLQWTDAKVLENKLYFSAVVEDTTSVYHDGELLASAIGCLHLDTNRLEWLEYISPEYKVEGIEMTSVEDDTINVVT